MRTVRLSKGFSAVCAAVLAAASLSGCGEKRLKAVDYIQFSDELIAGGYYIVDGLTSDSEDGTSSIIMTNNGWLAGFYECSDKDVAVTEFDYECDQAEIDSVMDGPNYTIADKKTDEEYLLYVRVDNTCLFMRGLPDDEKEINEFADRLGYSVPQQSERIEKKGKVYE